VWFVRRKYPDAPHYEVSGTLLGTDECGTWIGCHKGERVRMPTGEERSMEYTGVVCIPVDDWFAMQYWHEHPEVDLYVDIASPAVWSSDKVTVVDLDFDVIRWNQSKGGAVELVDEDEFEDHRVALNYPDELQASARRAAQDVLACVQAATPPFTVAHARRWLDELLGLEGEAIRALD
jgi:protein associated with RNAse G/E